MFNPIPSLSHTRLRCPTSFSFPKVLRQRPVTLPVPCSSARQLVSVYETCSLDPDPWIDQDTNVHPSFIDERLVGNAGMEWILLHLPFA